MYNTIGTLEIYDLDIKTGDQKSHKKIYGKEEEIQILKLDLRFRKIEKII